MLTRELMVKNGKKFRAHKGITAHQPLLNLLQLSQEVLRQAFPYATERHMASKLHINWNQHGKKVKVRLQCPHSTRTGTYIEFQSAPGFDIKIKSLEDLRKGIRLCNVRQEDSIKEDGTKEATLFITTYVPNDQKQVFFNKVEAYLNEETASGNPRNKDLIDGINDLRNAILVESFWTDTKSLMPEDNQKEWCEVWLRDDDGAENRFETVINMLNIESKTGSIKFPERLVKLILASRHDIGRINKAL